MCRLVHGWGIFDAPLGSDQAGLVGGWDSRYSIPARINLNGVFSFGNIMSKRLRWLSLRSISLLHGNLL